MLSVDSWENTENQPSVSKRFEGSPALAWFCCQSLWLSEMVELQKSQTPVQLSRAPSPARPGQDNSCSPGPLPMSQPSQQPKPRCLCLLPPQPPSKSSRSYAQAGRRQAHSHAQSTLLSPGVHPPPPSHAQILPSFEVHLTYHHYKALSALDLPLSSTNTPRSSCPVLLWAYKLTSPRGSRFFRGTVLVIWKPPQRTQEREALTDHS